MPRTSSDYRDILDDLKAHKWDQNKVNTKNDQEQDPPLLESLFVLTLPLPLNVEAYSCLQVLVDTKVQNIVCVFSLKIQLLLKLKPHVKTTSKICIQ